MAAEDNLKAIGDKRFYTKFDETKRQADIRKKQVEVAEKMNIARDLIEQRKLDEAEVVVRQIREIDPDNLAARASLHIITTKCEQENYDRGVHNNEKIFLKALDVSLGTYADMTNPVIYQKGKKIRERSGGEIRHDISDPRERAIDSRLRQPISLNFKDTPLQEAIDTLTQLSGIQVLADKKALKEAHVNLDSPMTIKVENINMKNALNLMLNELGLTYTIEDEVLKITTPEYTKGRLVRVTYPVADLIVVVPDHPLPDVYNMEKAIERANQFRGWGCTTTSS